MTPFVLSQILVGIAFVFDLVSFQLKDRKHILLTLVISTAFIGAHFLILGRLTAGLIIGVSLVRFVLAYYSTSRKLMLLCMIAAAIVFMFTYAGWLSILPFVASLIQSYSSFCPRDKQLRLWMMLGTAIWIVHNALIGSPVAVLVEVFFLGSNLVGYYRFYIRSPRPV